ncbi:hypothetical protein ABLT31_22045 [Ammoniphilus sp. 3BR4]
MKNKRLGFRVILILVSGFILGGILSPKDYTTIKPENPISERTKLKAITFNGNIEPFQRFVSINYEFYNETTGWGKANRLNWNTQRQRAELLLNALDSVKVDDKRVKHDIENIIGLSKILQQSRQDKVSVIYLHRIFHDLDKSMNDYKHPDAFGMSYTLGVDKKSRFWGDTVFDMEDYIKESIK